MNLLSIHISDKAVFDNANCYVKLMLMVGVALYDPPYRKAEV